MGFEKLMLRRAKLFSGFIYFLVLSAMMFLFQNSLDIAGFRIFYTPISFVVFFVLPGATAIATYAAIKIKEGEKRFKNLFQSINDGIYITNLSRTKIFEVNRAACEKTGYTRDELIENSMWSLDKDRDREEAMDIVKDLKKGESKRFEAVHIKKDEKEYEVEVNARKINYEGREAILNIARDISERKRMERELKRTNKNLKDYTYAVSHDLKEPLRGVSTFTSFLLEDYTSQLDEEGKEYLLRMRNTVNRMGDLIEDLLTLSRVGRKHVEFSKVNLNDLLEEIKMDQINRIRENNAEIINDDLPTVGCQRTWIKQVFSNLISNGIKFNDSEEPKVRVNYKDNGSYYEFVVADNGIGIPEKLQDKIFKIFERLNSREYDGTGAGLAICKKVVKEHDGEIWVSSERGEGSEFHFTVKKGLIDLEKINGEE